MKVVSYIFLFSIVLLGCTSNPKSGEANSSATVDAGSKAGHNLIDTAAYVQRIENYRDSVDHHLKNFSAKKREVNGESTEGGEVTFYVDDQDTLKISAIYYGETGQAAHNFYLKDKDLVFLDQKTTYYKYPIGVEKVEVDRVDHDAFILKNGKILKEIDVKDSLSNSYFEKEAEIGKLYKEIRVGGEK